MKRSLLFIGVILVAGCGGGEDDAEVPAEPVEDSNEPESAEDDGEAAATPVEDSVEDLVTPDEPWAQTLGFIESLEKLMVDYQPELPDVPEQVPSLACVPKTVLAASTELASEVGRLDKLRAAAERARREAREEALEAAGIYDPIWTTRTETPRPSPLLMQLAEEAGVTAPPTLLCRISDVSTRRRSTSVACEMLPGRLPSSMSIDLGKGDIGWWTRGAVLSVPLADESAGYLTRSSTDAGAWTIHASAEHVTVSDPGSCPTPDALLEQVRAATPVAEAAPAPEASPAGAGSGGGGGLGGLGTRGTGSGGSGYGRGRGFYGKQGGGAPGVSRGRAIIMGALDKSIIDRVVKSHLRQIRFCYEKELSKDPKLSGKILVRYVIAADGTVSSAETAMSTMKNPIVEQCVNKKFLRMKYPSPKGGGVVIVKYPFVFNASG